MGCWEILRPQLWRLFKWGYKAMQLGYCNKYLLSIVTDSWRWGWWYPSSALGTTLKFKKTMWLRRYWLFYTIPGKHTFSVQWHILLVVHFLVISKHKNSTCMPHTHHNNNNVLSYSNEQKEVLNTTIQLITHAQEEWALVYRHIFKGAISS